MEEPTSNPRVNLTKDLSDRMGTHLGDSGLPQVHVARLMGISQGYLSQCLGGSRDTIDPIHLARFCAITNYKLDSAFNEGNGRPSEEAQQEYDAMQADLRYRVFGLTPYELRKILLTTTKTMSGIGLADEIPTLNILCRRCRNRARMVGDEESLDLYFNSLDLLAHFHTFISTGKQLYQELRNYHVFQDMEEIVGRLGNPESARRLLARRGDAKRIWSDYKGAYLDLDQAVKMSDDPKVYVYPALRSLCIALATCDLNSEFQHFASKLEYAVGEVGGDLPISTRVHAYEGLSQAYAERFSATQNTQDSRQAIRAWEDSANQLRDPSYRSSRVLEFEIRTERLEVILATKNLLGLTQEEQAQKVENVLVMANDSGNIRIAEQMAEQQSRLAS